MLEGPLVYVDVETNGLSHTRGGVIEVAAIRVQNGKVIRTFNSVIDPGTELPQFISQLTGITTQECQSSPTFPEIADELYEVMEGAIFIAHNVRFDYSFLKQEFARAGKQFQPRMLCTVRLSRSLYPEYRSHKLESIIERLGLKAERRHRAYDDARVTMDFVQHAVASFPAEILEAALRRQIQAPSLPRGLNPEAAASLPEGPGVYILEDDGGNPLYIGKSLNIKRRVLSHFSSDHVNVSEFKISQSVANVSTHQTNGELEALLLESQLIKELQPLFNKRLRRHQKLTLARRNLTDDGYIRVSVEDTGRIDPAGTEDILAVYTTKGRARVYFNEAIKNHLLCPKLMGFEKGGGSCFSYQLGKCMGACMGKEKAESYNARLMGYFEQRKIVEWPYKTPILVREKEAATDAASSIIVDKWCVIARIEQQEECSPDIQLYSRNFDIDTYKILRSYIRDKVHKLHIKPISSLELNRLVLKEGLL